MTPSRSGTRCPPNQRRPPATRRRQPANCGCTVKVTFCVRGVVSPVLANLFPALCFRQVDGAELPLHPFREIRGRHYLPLPKRKRSSQALECPGGPLQDL